LHIYPRVIGYFQSHHGEVEYVCKDVLVCRFASRFSRVEPSQTKDLVGLSYLHREKWSTIDVEIAAPDLIAKGELFAAKEPSVLRIAPEAYFLENFPYSGISRGFMRFDFPARKIPDGAVPCPLLDREKT